MVDKFINITDDSNLNYYTDVFEYKSFAEISQVLKIYDVFLKNIDLNNIKYFLKISGRYVINDSFDYTMFDNNMNIFSKNNNVTDREYYYTCFYKLNKKTIPILIEKLRDCINNKEKYLSYDLEVIIPKLLNYEFTKIDKLGITQNISVWKETSSI